METCPVSSLVQDFGNSGKVKVENSCIECNLCVPACPIKVISIVKKTKKAADKKNANKVEKDKKSLTKKEEVKKNGATGTRL